MSKKYKVITDVFEAYRYGEYIIESKNGYYHDGINLGDDSTLLRSVVENTPEWFELLQDDKDKDVRKMRKLANKTRKQHKKTIDQCEKLACEQCPIENCDSAPCNWKLKS